MLGTLRCATSQLNKAGINPSSEFVVSLERNWYQLLLPWWQYLFPPLSFSSHCEIKDFIPFRVWRGEQNYEKEEEKWEAGRSYKNLQIAPGTYTSQLLQQGIAALSSGAVPGFPVISHFPGLWAQALAVVGSCWKCAQLSCCSWPSLPWFSSRFLTKHLASPN